MPNFHTIVSYSLRSLVVAHLLGLAILLGIHQLSFHHPLHPFSATPVEVAFYAVIYLIVGLLVLDWATRKDPSRRNSKVLEIVLGVAWALLIGAMIFYSW
jgi:hypothetical protein